MSGLPYLQMGWGKLFRNICFYNQQNPQRVTLQSILTETAFRLESFSRNMCDGSIKNRRARAEANWIRPTVIVNQ